MILIQKRIKEVGAWPAISLISDLQMLEAPYFKNKEINLLSSH